MARQSEISVLLDTCAVLALANGELSVEAAATLRRATGAFVSVVTPWELAIKVARGKLALTAPTCEWFVAMVDRYDLQEVPLDARLACSAAALPPLHRDPFDRVIVALAQTHALTILTSDEDIRKYPGVSIVW